MTTSRQERQAARMSVEQPLWRALTAYRVLTLAYALLLYGMAFSEYDDPLLAGAYMAVLAVWTLGTLGRVADAGRCTKRFLTLDLGLAVVGILLTAVVDTDERIVEGVATLPSIWTAGSVLAFAIKGGWRWAAVAAAVVGAANVVERGGLSGDTVHNVLLVWVAAIAIGYVVEVARASERVLAEALRVEAATRERERLARDIHDSVLQVLALVQRRGVEAGGEAAAIGRMAGEQEIALRALITDGFVPDRHGTPAGTDDDGPVDLRVRLGSLAGAKVTVSAPATAVLLEPHAAAELTAAVKAALDNVDRHAGAAAHAWILVEDEPGEVLVSVRDDGPGIAEGRLTEAESEGRLGVAQSILGRLRDLGGGVDIVSTPGQGVEIELRLPRRAAVRNAGGLPDRTA